MIFSSTVKICLRWRENGSRKSRDYVVENLSFGEKLHKGRRCLRRLERQRHSNHQMSNPDNGLNRDRRGVGKGASKKYSYGGSNADYIQLPCPKVIFGCPGFRSPYTGSVTGAKQ